MIAAYEVAGYILRNDVTSLALVGVAFVGGAFIVAILNNWRNGVYFFLAWLLFEDFARKYLGNNMAIYFAKDFLVAIVYLSFFIAYRRKDKDLQVLRPPFLMALLVFVWFGFLQVFNPGSTSIFFGFLGMKLYFYYIRLRTDQLGTCAAAFFLHQSKPDAGNRCPRNCPGRSRAYISQS